MINPKRLERIKKTVANRQLNLAVILENVHDPHNIGAVLRTCDSVGVQEVFVLFSEPQLTKEKLKLGKRTSAGARKWLDVYLYNDPAACFARVRQRYQTILASRIDDNSTPHYDLDLCGSLALIFGNEHDGISSESLEYADGSFYIPQAGMVQSLNISVACAVTLFEAMRQRKEKGFYPFPEKGAKQEAIFQEFIRRHEDRDNNHIIFEE